MHGLREVNYLMATLDLCRPLLVRSGHKSDWHVGGAAQLLNGGLTHNLCEGCLDVCHMGLKASADLLVLVLQQSLTARLQQSRPHWLGAQVASWHSASVSCCQAEHKAVRKTQCQ